MPTPSLAIIVIDPGDTSNLAELLEDMPESLPVIVVSDIEDADQIVRTLQRGARGYIPTNLPLSIAVEAVRLVGAGGVFVPASSFVHGKQPPTPDKSGEILTKRETAVVEEIRSATNGNYALGDKRFQAQIAPQPDETRRVGPLGLGR